MGAMMNGHQGSPCVLSSLCVCHVVGFGGMVIIFILCYLAILYIFVCGLSTCIHYINTGELPQCHRNSQSSASHVIVQSDQSEAVFDAYANVNFFSFFCFVCLLCRCYFHMAIYDEIQLYAIYVTKYSSMLFIFLVIGASR